MSNRQGKSYGSLRVDVECGEASPNHMGPGGLRDPDLWDTRVRCIDYLSEKTAEALIPGFMEGIVGWSLICGDENELARLAESLVPTWFAWNCRDSHL